MILRRIDCVIKSVRPALTMVLSEYNIASSVAISPETSLRSSSIN